VAAKFAKTYLVFFASSLLINVSMEALLCPENLAIVNQIIIFYILFSLLGALVFLRKSCGPRGMGVLSFIFGFIFEFTFMLPDWVRNVYALKINMDTAAAVVVSAFYWFLAWAAPSFVIHRWALWRRQV